VTDPFRRLLGKAKRELITRRLRAGANRDTTPPLSSEYASYGAGTLVLPPARVQLPGQIRLGAGVMLHEHAWLCLQQAPGLPAPELAIGDGTRIGRAVKIVCMGSVSIGRDVLMADFVYIADAEYSNDDPTLPVSKQPRSAPAPVTIGDGVFLGIRVQVHPGVSIGEKAYVAGGAVVVDDVEPLTVVAGNPARPIRRYDDASGTWVRV
jgi:carbonic anhydrase/acetyltransferase-like protein (isoleucine patch superfamily)